jgi:hypothetical protein
MVYNADFCEKHFTLSPITIALLLLFYRITRIRKKQNVIAKSVLALNVTNKDVDIFGLKIHNFIYLISAQ